MVFGHAEVVKYLLEKGADKNHKVARVFFSFVFALFLLFCSWFFCVKVVVARLLLACCVDVMRGAGGVCAGGLYLHKASGFKV